MTLARLLVKIEAIDDDIKAATDEIKDLEADIAGLVEKRERVKTRVAEFRANPPIRGPEHDAMFTSTVDIIIEILRAIPVSRDDLTLIETLDDARDWARLSDQRTHVRLMVETVRGNITKLTDVGMVDEDDDYIILIDAIKEKVHGPRRMG